MDYDSVPYDTLKTIYETDDDEQILLDNPILQKIIEAMRQQEVTRETPTEPETDAPTETTATTVTEPDSETEPPAESPGREHLANDYDIRHDSHNVGYNCNNYRLGSQHDL